MQEIIINCKFYGDAEDILYKSKGEVDKIGFRNLQNRCQEELGKCLKSDEDRIRSMIEGNKPSKIPFKELKIWYKKFMNIKGIEGPRKRRIITSELRKVE
jgi:molybdopterin-guanine dinucleotide biosynthesis protein A